MRTRKCEKCGKEFSSRWYQQIFCDAKCRCIAWVANNRERHNAAVRKYRRARYAREGCWRDESPGAKKLKQWMVEIKAAPCSDCGNCFPTCCMDFDHREGTVKKFNVGSMFAHHYSRELIETEIEKCELVCANCHRIRTQKRKIGKPRISKVSQN